MKILVLSDLNWEAHMRSITHREYKAFAESHLEIERYQRIRRYFIIIQEENPDLVLFAGDVCGDGACGHGFHFSFLILLKLLEGIELHSAFIGGNHDLPEYYEQLITGISELKYTKEISDKYYEYNGFKVLGVNYNTTKSKRSWKKFLKQSTNPVDLVLAHSQLKRRIRLFNLDAQYVVTGHYDRKLMCYRNQVFVALDNDNNEVSYLTIDRKGSKDVVCFCVKQEDGNILTLEEETNSLVLDKRKSIMKVNGKESIRLNQIEKIDDSKLSDHTADYTYIKYLRGQAYKSVLNALVSLKDKKESPETALKRISLIGTQVTANYKISERLVADFLGE